jgi:hypothetical protein
MPENIQKSPSLKQMVDASMHLKQQLEYFEGTFRILKVKK